MEPIVNIADLVRKAHAAAKAKQTLNESCPWPFHTEAGKMFKAEYLKAVSAMEAS